jgi:hypothetical protein
MPSALALRGARLLPALLAALPLVCAAGCSPKTATVSGKVTVNNKPVTAGVITFYPDEESGAKPASANIKADGTYEVGNAPVGKVKVAVGPPPGPPPGGGAPPIPNRGGRFGPPPGAGGPPADATEKMRDKPPSDETPAQAPKGPPIPVKYGDPEKSELTYDIPKGGTKDANFDLK